MKRILFIGFLFTACLGFGQVKDAHFWTSVGVSADLSDRFSASYEMQTRFHKNASTLDAYNNDIGLKYEAFKNLDFSLDYRYSYKQKEGYSEGVNRICFNTSYSKKFKDSGIRLKGRARYQLPFDRLGVVNDNIYPDNRNIFRFKLSLDYKNKDFKLIQPFVSYEFYKSFLPKNQYSPIDSYRLSMGLEFDLPKRHSVEIYYIFEHEFRSAPQRNYMYCIQYNYDLFKDPIWGKKEEKL